MDNRLSENLKNVQQNYIIPFLWLHGVDVGKVINVIDKIYDSGIRSVCLESRPHKEFCRDGWWRDVGIILEECKKRDMKVWMLDDKHYPSGSANDIFREKYKDMQAWGICENHIDVSGPIEDGCAMADC